jgi:uncharacterized membrane protein YbhN (UPF0104 family)
MPKKLKSILGSIIIAITIAVFAYYLYRHPETIGQLTHVSPAVIIILLITNIISFLAYVSITRTALHIYLKSMPWQENILFNAYSSLINFFGPGQSGPIFRAAYLKKRHGLGVKQFIFTTLIYLGFFAVISSLMIAASSLPWWLAIGLVVMVSAISYFVINKYRQKQNIHAAGGLNAVTLGRMLTANIIQITAVAVMYAIELKLVGADVTLSQVLIYTGMANLALFVALTPGAIGIREGFLVFSQNLHHIDSTAIVAANILDRAVYVIFLGLLFILVIGLHARDKLNVKQLKTDL